MVSRLPTFALKGWRIEPLWVAAFALLLCRSCRRIDHQHVVDPFHRRRSLRDCHPHQLVQLPRPRQKGSGIMNKHIEIPRPKKGSIKIGNDLPLVFFLGPCQMGSRAHALETSSILKNSAKNTALISSINPRSTRPTVRQSRPNAESGSKKPCRYSKKSAKRPVFPSSPTFTNAIEVIGYSGLRVVPETDYIELMYGLGRKFWGKGIGYEAGFASLRFAFETACIERIIAAVLPQSSFFKADN